jgi:hypothetical protein
MIRAVALILCSIVATAAHAQMPQRDMQSANFMLPYCKMILEMKRTPSPGERTPSPGESMGIGMCAGIVDGIAFGAQGRGENLGICAPPNATGEQRMRVVVRFLEQNPARLHENFLRLTHEALLQAWPCK